MKYCMITFLFVVFFPFGTRAATYYISPDCQYSGDGSSIDCAAGTGKKGAYNTWAIDYSCGNSYQGKKGTVWQASNTMDLDYKTCSSDTVLELTSYGSGEDPTITGQAAIPYWNVPEAWTQVGSKDIWVITLKENPRRVWLSGQEYGEAEDSASIDKDYRWFYVNKILYVYAKSNPSEMYLNMEGWQNLASIMRLANSDYIDIHGLHIIGGREQAIEAISADYVKFYNNTITGTLEIRYSKDIPSTNWDIYSNTFDSLYTIPVKHDPFYSDTSDGVQLRCAQNNTVRNNTFKNITHSAVMIYCYEKGIEDGASYNKIYENYIYQDVSGDFYGRCFGIGGLNHSGGGGAMENLITRNMCINQHARSQIAGYDNTISYNIFSGSRNNSSYRKTLGQAIMVTESGPRGEASGIKIVNNTFYDTDEPAIEIDEEDSLFPTDIEIKNNIIHSAGKKSQQRMDNIAIEVDDFPRIDGIAIENNVIFNRGVADVIYYRGAWTSLKKLTPVGNDTNLGNRNADPLLKDPAGGDFTLVDQSPAIDAGADLGPSFDQALLPGSSWPAGVASEKQGADGKCWEAGAFIFPDKEGTSPCNK